MRASGAVNGVSRLHGEVTKQMWQPIWPGVPVEKLPVRSITNGVHVSTWMSSEIGALLERHLGPNWLDSHDDPAVIDRVMDIPDEELWAARQALRSFLFNFIRERARTRWTHEHVERGADRRRRHDLRSEHAHASASPGASPATSAPS